MAHKDINKEDLKNNIDPELDELLDSALREMAKKPVTATSLAAEAPTNDADNGLPPHMWTKKFTKEAAQQFESLLGSYAGIPENQLTQEQIAQTFTKIADISANAFKSSEAPANTPNADVNAAIANMMRCLYANAEAIHGPFSDQDLSNMFSTLNTKGGKQDDMFVSFIQGMMQSLLSKKVLYASLKELIDKYPTYLEENKGKIEESEYNRFYKQQKLMEKICLELEPEQESDPDEMKRKRFEKVVELMQKMQDLGQPPKELGGDIYEYCATTPGFLAENTIPRNTPNCIIM